MILHEAGERTGMTEWRDTISYRLSATGEPVIVITKTDNYDDPGRMPARTETEELSIDQFLRSFGADHPAVIAYHRVAAGAD